MQELIAKLIEAMKIEREVGVACREAHQKYETLERERGAVDARVRELRGELMAEIAAGAGYSAEGIAWIKEHTL